MKVLFRVAVGVCIIVTYLPNLLTSAQGSETTTDPSANISDQPEESTPTNESISECNNFNEPIIQPIEPNKTFTSITWDIRQTDQNCIPEYLTVNCTALEEDNPQGEAWVIQSGSGGGAIENSNNSITVTIEDLSEFTNYTCNGEWTMSDGQTIMSSQITFRTKPEVASEPLNLTMPTTPKPTVISVKWAKPFKNPGVFESYQTHIVSLGPDHFLPNSCGENNTIDMWNETISESYIFYHLRANYRYEISVSLKNSAGNGNSTSINAVTARAAPEEPRNFSMGKSVLDEEANVITRSISWNTPCEPNGPIDQYEIYLEGYYILDENQIRNKSLKIVNATETEEYSTQIILLPAFVYTISIRAKGENMPGMFYNETFQTEDNLPGVPHINNVTEKGSTFFVVSWTKPERKAGNITQYTIEITSIMPLYDRDMKRCPFQTEVFSKTLSGDSTTYNFTDGHPYYKYSISITATTSRGIGEPSVIFVETEASVPEKPDHLSFQYLMDDGIGLISWTAPCNINGPITEFNIMVNGTYADDSSLSDLHPPETVQFVNGTYNYSHRVKLFDAYTYDAYIKVILKDGPDGEVGRTNVTTPDGFPGMPIIYDAMDVGESSFTAKWEPPREKNGRINFYKIDIVSLGPLYKTHCPVDNNSTTRTTNGSITTFTFTEGKPYYNYSVTITASTSRGFGNSSREVFVITQQSIPETVQHVQSNTSDPEGEDYTAYAYVSFEEPCHINGKLENYELDFHGSRPNYNDHTDRINPNSTGLFVFDLKPEFQYSFSIKTINQRFDNSSDSRTFQAPAGVPKFSSTLDLNIKTGSTSAQTTLRNTYFDEVNGDIKFVAIIISEENVTGGDYRRWDGENWPPIEDNAVYYQISQDKWNPFENASIVTITIGNETDCDESQNYCNKPLKADQDYYLIIRIFTSHFYKNSPTIYFRTDDVSKLGMILGIIFGLLAFALVGVAGFFVWKKNLLKLPTFYPRKSSIKTPSTASTAIPNYKFMQYCKSLENNPEKLTEQYTLLTEKTKEAVRMQTTVYAELTENRRKNRYTNILPYDETRVKLLIDEDDEIGSDYINASYIRGYSGKIEYIATQGPLPTTSRDFWKMVIQENVSIIVMVTQFIEQNKEKCYKYFPNNHESMLIGEDMEVKCSMELHFGTYCVRTLQVKKDTTQVTVTHMQYLDWPDFNVPKGTENMLQFCYQLRERLKIEGGYVIIHCSAGVGRTGTLIATDILLQSVIAGKNIDVFNTVLELRKQRTHMVQTQKQYMYIHNLIKDNFDQSHSPGLNENSEPVYENLSAVKMKADDDNLIATDEESESQF